MEAARRNPLQKMSPALAGSLVLHGLIAAALLISWPKEIPIGTVVPVTIVTQGPPDVRPAEKAPQEQTAQTEEPEPAPPEPTPPTPAPAPPPPPPTPTPTPRPTPTPPPKPAPKPTPAKPAPTPPRPTPPEKTLDFDALQKSIARSRARNPSPPAPAPRGPTRQETAVEARPAVGPALGLSASALGALAAELQRRWNPNCEVEGGADVNVRVVFRLGSGGQLMGPPVAQNIAGASPVVRAAAERAVRAVRQAEPFENLPSDLFGQQIVVNFNAKQACS